MEVESARCREELLVKDSQITALESRLQAATARALEQAEQVGQLQAQVAQETRAAVRAQRELRCLQPEFDAVQHQVHALERQLSGARRTRETLAAKYALARREGASLERRNTDLLRTQQRLRDDVGDKEAELEGARNEILGYQATLSLPRYRIATRLNSVLRMTGPLHSALKRFVRSSLPSTR
jgi:chromosome segregation ATPase